jgi:SbcC/RAD50-like, Walker B motif
MRGPKRALPRPHRERWQPLRGGFVNLYKYDREEFHFENGRLLLRGNNGTGKSRVLALQLPFLLDGEVNPQRLEPDADPSKRVEWNLLMDRYPDRTGYTWIEFGRHDEESGDEHYLTLGCGLSAVEGRAGARQWFFITTQRIGEQLELVTEGKQVVNKERLREKIGAAGNVFDSAGPYRKAVDEALFQLGQYRYASLLNLLIQLRRPQLTRRLEEEELSRALGEALPPVAPDVIANLAEAFRQIDSDRHQLASSRTALAAVEHFLTGYRRYAEIAAKRRAVRVLAAHSEYEGVMQGVLTAEAECDRSLAELARLRTELQALSSEENALQAEIQSFQQGPANNAYELLREAADRRKDAERAAAELAEASGHRKACLDEHVRLNKRMRRGETRLKEAIDAVQQAAISAGLEAAHHDVFRKLDTRTAADAALNEARESLEAQIQSQLEKIEHAAELNERLASATVEFQRAAAERDQMSGLLDDAREHLNGARAEHQTAVNSFLTAVCDWTAELTELPLPFDQTFLGSVAAWCQKPDVPNPFFFASRKALDELTANFSDSRAYLKQIEKTRTEELAQLEIQQDAARSAGALEEAQSSLDSVLDSIDDLNRRETVLRNEAYAAPADEGVRGAYEYSVAVGRHTDRLRNRLAEVEEYVREKQKHADHVAELRNHAAEDVGIIKWIGDLDALRSNVALYRLALASLWAAVESFQGARRETEWASSHLQQASTQEERRKEQADELDRRAVTAEIARDAAGRLTDTDSKEILQRVARARERLDALRIQEKKTRQRYHDTEVAVTRVDERLRNRTEMLTGQTDKRDTAASSLLTFASTGLLELVAPGITFNDADRSSKRAVEMAFELKSRLDSIDAGDRAWDNHQKSVPAEFNTLLQVLSAQRCRSAAAFRDDVFVATAIFAGKECAMDELREILSEDVSARQLLVDAREREILENHLNGKVSGHLRELLCAAEEQVRQMNDELESRPTSTGMKLRFVWRPAEDAPSGTNEARERLMQANDIWSSADRQMLGSFLQRQIQAAGPDIEHVSWQESLADALDYRKWHRFGVERYQDGVWKRLTRRTHGTGSGGEKAVALMLPQFAAAAAFYRTADPLAPRLILLDEAFVGIDADMRAKCMGLIHAFDLDFMMTSEREWGCYPTLPGLAIYQLSTRPGIDAVGLTRWVWNGRQRDLHSTELAGDLVALGSP